MIRASRALLVISLAAGAVAAADSPAGPPSIDVRCGGLTHLAVGTSVPLTLLDHREGWLERTDGVTFHVEPADVAEVTPNGQLLGKRPGRAQITGTLAGVGTSLPRTLWVVEALEGGVLPRLEGLEPTREWRLEWLVGPETVPGLVLGWEGSTHALNLRVQGLPAGPPPWTLPVPRESVRYGRFDAGRSPWDTTPAPRQATLTVAGWTAGVARGRVEIEQADGRRVDVRFTASLPMPLHPELVGRLIVTAERPLTAGGTRVRTVRSWPRGPVLLPRVLLVPPATGLDRAVVAWTQQLAGHGYDVTAVDIYAGATAPDPTVLAEGHVPRDAAAAEARAALVRAMDATRIEAVLAQALKALGPTTGSLGVPPGYGVVAWGEACVHVARAASARGGLDGAVLVDPGPEVAHALLAASFGPTCVVLGTKGSPAAAALADTLRQGASGARSGIEVWAYEAAAPGFADPRWMPHYGYEATQAAHGRALAFLEAHVR